GRQEQGHHPPCDAEEGEPREDQMEDPEDLDRCRCHGSRDGGTRRQGGLRRRLVGRGLVHRRDPSRMARCCPHRGTSVLPPALRRSLTSRVTPEEQLQILTAGTAKVLSEKE